MDNLVTLLYWADTLPSLASWLCFASAILMLVFGAILLLGITDFFGDARGEAHLQLMANRFRKIGLLCPLFFILWGSSFAVPTQETLYLIAAAQIREQASPTPETAKIRDVLNRRLDEISAHRQAQQATK